MGFGILQLHSAFDDLGSWAGISWAVESYAAWAIAGVVHAALVNLPGARSCRQKENKNAHVSDPICGK